MADIRTRRLRLVSAVTLVVLLAAGGWWLYAERHVVRCDDAYVSGNVVPVQALVPGSITAVAADDSMAVAAGQVLVTQDHSLLDADLDEIGAALGEALRTIRSRFAEAEEATHEIAARRVRKARLEADLARYRAAQSGGAVAEQKVTDTRADLDIVSQQIAAAEARLRKVRTLIDGVRAEDNPAVKKLAARYIASHVRRQRADVQAPVAGFVANRRVQAGQQVTAGQVLLSLVPLDALWVTANIKETAMADVRPGLPVAVHAHLYGGDFDYHGEVVGILPAAGSTFSLFPPDNTTGNYIHIVERVPVRIALDADELRAHPLRPGLSLDVTIDTAAPPRHAPGAVAVDTQADSYRTTIYARETAAAEAALAAVMAAN